MSLFAISFWQINYLIPLISVLAENRSACQWLITVISLTSTDKNNGGRCCPSVNLTVRALAHKFNFAHLICRLFKNTKHWILIWAMILDNATVMESNDRASCTYAISIFFTTTMALISLAAFIGNILVIASVYKTPRLRTSTNYYYVNMAASDFLSSLATWPALSHWQDNNKPWKPNSRSSGQCWMQTGSVCEASVFLCFHS